MPANPVSRTITASGATCKGGPLTARNYCGSAPGRAPFKLINHCPDEVLKAYEAA